MKTCADIMKGDLEWVEPQDSVLRAARRMRDRNIGFLPVCDEHGKVLGVLTDRDVATRVAAADKTASATPVADVMTKGPISCRPDDDVRVAEDKMATYEKSRILVTNERGTLLGVISMADIAAHEPRRRAAKTARKVAAREVHG